MLPMLLSTLKSLRSRKNKGETRVALFSTLFLLSQFRPHFDSSNHVDSLKELREEVEKLKNDCAFKIREESAKSFIPLIHPTTVSAFIFNLFQFIPEKIEDVSNHNAVHGSLLQLLVFSKGWNEFVSHIFYKCCFQNIFPLFPIGKGNHNLQLKFYVKWI